jgi:short-subunit dehydrogenase
MPHSYWQSKTCLVTGASSGLGLALARTLADRGASVILVARRPEPLEAAAADLRQTGARVAAIPANLTWQDDVNFLADKVNSDFGRLDFLANCAGRSTRGAVLDTTPEDFQQLLDVNFLATVRVTRALAPLLTAHRGHLVNIGSLASRVAPRYMGAYPASKHALAAYTQQLRLELSPQGVHVLHVCPGPIARHPGVARPGGLPKGVVESPSDSTTPPSGRYADEAPDIPAEAQAPGAGAKIKAIDPHRLAAVILKACERRRPELVIPPKAKWLFAISQLSASWGDWLLGRSTKRN